MTVKIDRFGGIAPRQHPTQLADGMAVTAHNCRLKTGKLVPLKEPKVVDGVNILLENGLADIADAKSMHAWKRRDGSIEFLMFPGITHMAEGNIADDERTRVVVSGETGVSWTDGKGMVYENTPCVYMRGTTGQKIIHPILKTTLPAPKVTRTSSGELTDNRRYTRFFLTWVDAYGYESPVSEPSLVQENGIWVEGDLEYMDGDNVSIAAIGAANKPNGAVAIRVYKVVTGAEEGRIQFIKEVSATDTLAWDIGISVQVKDEDAGEVLCEIESPPADLRQICDVPGEFYCGISATSPKTVFFSDVGLLYSWPVAYRYDVKDNIVALAVTSNTVFALTDGWPYVLTGTAPESMTVSKLAGPAACVSERGVCVYRNAVFFVSNAGLMTIYNDADAGTVCTNLTDKIFTKDQWLAFNPSSCIMGQFDGALLLFFTLADGTKRGLVIDLMESAAAVSTHSEAAACLCTDNKTDKMYYVRNVAQTATPTAQTAQEGE